MGCMPASRHQVLHAHPRQKRGVIGDKTAVASPPHALTAHDGRRSTGDILYDFGESVLKVRGAHIPGICPERIIAQGGVRRAGQKLTKAPQPFFPPV